MILYSNAPELDLHGLDSEYGRILVNEFIEDNYKLKNEYIVIVHGKGTGILKKMVQSTLKNNKFVLEYKIDNFNDGATIVKLDLKK